MQDNQKFNHLRFNDNFSVPQKNISVPKESDRSQFFDQLPDGLAGEMLVFELKDGRAVAYPYHLVTKVSFNSTSELTIHYNDEVVFINGVCLIELFRLLTRHQLVLIRERETRGFDTPNGKLCITKIEIKKSV